MPRRGLPMIAAAMLILCGMSSGEASAQELSRLLRARVQTPNVVATPQGASAGIPTPYRYAGVPQSAPWYGYGFGVPTYSWGWFGATYRPAVICHRGYYDDFYQWGYRQGY
jgi:hypothetical protein